MSSKIYFEYARELGGVRILREDKHVVGPAIVPADGNEYPIGIFGLSLQDFALDSASPDVELQWEETIGEDLVVSVSLNGLIKVHRLGDEFKSPVYVQNGKIVVTDGIRVMTEAQALTVLLTAIQSSLSPVDYWHLVNVMEESGLTQHIPYLVKTCHTNIAFRRPIRTSHDISIGAEGVATYCLINELRDYLRGIHFTVADDVVYVSEMRAEITRYTLPIDGNCKHIHQLGIGMPDLRSVLPDYLYQPTGVYVIPLTSEVSVSINALGLIRAYTKASEEKVVAKMAVALDGGLQHQGLSLLESQEEIEPLLVYTLLSSFNTVNRNELKAFMESKGLEDKYEYLLRKAYTIDAGELVER